MTLVVETNLKEWLPCVRGEAHCFARHYSYILRTKKMLNENP
jgi:hypothetical protein